MKKIRSGYKLYLLLFVACLARTQAICQQVIPVIHSGKSAVTVHVQQQLQLGAFTQGNPGGTIRIHTDGSRTSNGAVVPLNFGASYSPLILEIEGPKGSIVSMMGAETTVLTGSNGGTMRLKLMETSPEAPFVITDDPPAKRIIKIGAELTVGNLIESPAGNYSGSLHISFVVE